MQKERMTVTLDPKTITKVEEAAIKEKRNKSNMVELLLEEALEARERN